jgi:hypothetical protein
MDDDLTFDLFREAWLADVREGAPSTVELGRRFAHKLLSQWLDIGDASDDLVYCDGSGDGGIDIAYLDRTDAEPAEGAEQVEGDTWYLVQSKYGTAFQGDETLLSESVKVLDTLTGRRAKLSSLAGNVLERVQIFLRSASELDRLVLVFATEQPLNDDQRRLLDDIRAMGRNRLGPVFDVKSISIANIYEQALEQEVEDHRVRVPLRANLVTSGEDLMVGSIALFALYDFLTAYRRETENLDQLYEKNVRRFLGSRGRINKAIQQTLQDTPEKFGLYNNGITIVVEEFTADENGVYELVEPYVVNGCQTTRTVWEVFYRKMESGGTGVDPELAGWQRRARQGTVVTKVVKVHADSEHMLNAITRFTNTQNAVREKDFMALEKDFKAWARHMADEHSIFLEIQRGGWDSQRARQKQNPSIKPFTEYANAFDLLKVYASGWLLEAGTAFGRNSAFVPGGSVFKRVMNGADDDVTFGVADLYAAYRLQTAADQYGFGRGTERMSRRQTRFLYYLVVIDLLRDVLRMANLDASATGITQAMNTLFAAGNEDAARELLDNGIDLIDEYMNRESEDSVFKEPSFQTQFNNDLNALLKSEKLGKSEEVTPRLRSLIGDYRKVMRRPRKGMRSPSDQIRLAVVGHD